MCRRKSLGLQEEALSFNNEGSVGNILALIELKSISILIFLVLYTHIVAGYFLIESHKFQRLYLIISCFRYNFSSTGIGSRTIVFILNFLLSSNFFLTTEDGDCSGEVFVLERKEVFKHEESCNSNEMASSRLVNQALPVGTSYKDFGTNLHVEMRRRRRGRSSDEWITEARPDKIKLVIHKSITNTFLRTGNGTSTFLRLNTSFLLIALRSPTGSTER